MAFDFRHSVSLVIVALSALIPGPFERVAWQTISTTYAYQFVLGLKADSKGGKDWQRVGLKRGKRISLTDLAAITAADGFRDAKVATLQRRLRERYPAVLVLLEVEGHNGVPYCLPSSFIHEFLSPPAQVNHSHSNFDAGAESLH